MTLNLSEILKSKHALRHRLAVLPIAEKLRLLDELRERSQTIAASRVQIRRASGGA
jgi:hypothetical protein